MRTALLLMALLACSSPSKPASTTAPTAGSADNTPVLAFLDKLKS